MARETFESWIPEEWGGPVITKIGQLSAMEDLARPEPMTTDTKHVPRSGGVSITTAIPKGVAYPETAATNDDVLLAAQKIGNVLRVADEDLKDTAQVANIILTKQLEWARAYAIAFDCATLGTTAAQNGTTVPFTSLYKTLRTNGSESYTADGNRVVTAGTGANVTYAQLSQLFGKLEGGNYWNDADMAVVAHPAFKAQFRGILDTSGAPVFSEYSSMASGGGSTLFGVPIRWSLGARASAVMTDAPTGNPLAFLFNRQYVIKGNRSGVEYNLAGADSGPAFLTDEALLKVRVRRGFAVGRENAAAVLELIP